MVDMPDYQFITYSVLRVRPHTYTSGMFRSGFASLYGFIHYSFPLVVRL